MNFLTDFADQAVTLPAAGAVLMVLLAGRWWRGAWAWALGVAGVLGAMLALKLVMFACGARLDGWSTPSPSGHTAAAAVVYGGALALLVRPTRPGVGVALGGGVVAASVVALTRIGLGVHTVGDVAVGGVVGVAGAVGLRLLAGLRPPGVPGRRLAGAALLVMVALHGQRLQAEAEIRRLAVDIWPLTMCR